MAILVILTAILTETGRATAVTAVMETAATVMEAMAAAVTAAMVPLILMIFSEDSGGPATAPQGRRYSRVIVM